MRALLLACRARGAIRTHSSSRSSVRWRADLRLLLLREPLLLLLEPRRVVALPRDAGAAVELEDPAGDVVEEVAVVGDGDDRARVLLQEALEPRHRLGVEVVGGLVEQQQVGLLQQQPAERDAAPLAAREGASRRRPGGGQRSASMAISSWRSSSQPLPASIWSCSRACSSSSFSISSSSIGSAKRSLISSKRSSSAVVAATPSSTLPSTVFAGSSCGSCGRKPTVMPSAGAGLADEVLVHARHDAQQRALAGAVGAEHADLRAGEEGQPDALEDLALRRDHLAEVLHREDESGAMVAPALKFRVGPKWGPRRNPTRCRARGSRPRWIGAALARTLQAHRGETGRAVHAARHPPGGAPETGWCGPCWRRPWSRCRQRDRHRRFRRAPHPGRGSVPRPRRRRSADPCLPRERGHAALALRGHRRVAARLGRPATGRVDRTGAGRHRVAVAGRACAWRFFGAATGFFDARLARALGPAVGSSTRWTPTPPVGAAHPASGRCREGTPNVQPVLAAKGDPHLPGRWSRRLLLVRGHLPSSRSQRTAFMKRWRHRLPRRRTRGHRRVAAGGAGRGGRRRHWRISYRTGNRGTARGRLSPRGAGRRSATTT